MIGYIIGITIGSIVVITLLVLYWFYYRNQKHHDRNIREIGKSAELKINRDLKTWSKHTKNLFLPANYFKYHGNKIFEVDAVLLTSKALYVVEIKSIKGVIKGDAELSQWHKSLGQERFPIKNPIIQNEGHIEHILKLLEMKLPTISLIIYSNRADYIAVKNIPEHVVLIKHAQLFETLDAIEKSLPIKFSRHEMQNIFRKIKSFKTTKRRDIKWHRNFTQGKQRQHR